MSSIVSLGHDGTTDPPGGEGDGRLLLTLSHISTGMVYSHGLGNRKQNVGKQTEKYETFQELYPWVSQNPVGEKTMK